METILAITNIISVLVIPIAAVVVGQFLQSCAAKRKDKMAIFQCLMTHRASGWAHQDTVNALNSIDIIFVNDKEVRKCWTDLLAKYKPNYSSQEIGTAQCRLLEAMAQALGYGKKITWETIQTPYLPEGFIQRMENNAKYEKGQLAMAEFMMNMTCNPPPLGNAMVQQTANQEEEHHADA